MEKEKKDYYRASIEQTIEGLESAKEGLSSQEAKQRLEKHGKNELPGKKPPSFLKVLLHQFKSPLIYILLIAGIFSLVVGEVNDAIFIFIVIFINAALGTSQEWKAEKSAYALQTLISPEVTVLRDGEKKDIDAKDLVLGDICLIESGTKVSADLRLIESNSLQIDESFLTGESTAMEKDTETIEEEKPVGERSNIVFAGSSVLSGNGKGIVTATATDTQVGKIAEVVTETEKVKPPLLRRIERLSAQIAYVILGVGVLITAISLFRGEPFADIFILVVALAVAAIPEGLPVGITVVLSIGTNRMAKRHVIIRKLAAVESLGSCTCIASDKTGTLTLNKQVLKKISTAEGNRFLATGQGYAGEGKIVNEDESELDDAQKERLEEFAQALILCNGADLRLNKEDEWEYSGDPMDVAFLSFAYKVGLVPKKIRDKYEIIDEIPFASKNKYSAVLYKKEEKTIAAAKGAPEVILAMCENMQTLKGPKKIKDRSEIEKEVKRLASEGLRVLSAATLVFEKDSGKNGFDQKDLKKMTFLGLFGFIDPLRPDAKEAVDKCKKAGIRVIMITGDYPETAAHIAGKLGITGEKDNVLTGEDIEKMDDGEFAEKINDVHVFARVSPIVKLKIVEKLKEAGNFVAVTGDGVNDAPALRKADIGVAMGSGTDTAKDTASIIITDDNFASIEAGVEEGRFAYDNIRKVTYLLVSKGIAEILLILTAIIINIPIPLVAVQILWLNLVTNGIQDIALAFEGGEPGTMTKKPRDPGEGVFNRLMISQSLTSGIFIGMVALGVWIFLLRQDYEIARARNLVFLLLVLFQNFHVFNCRSETNSFFKIPISKNWILIFGVLGAQGLHIAALYIPFMQDILQTSPVSIMEWIVLACLAATVLLVMEIYKFIIRRFFNPMQAKNP
jgi:P-type Ca2+ transporter type 2C